MKRLSIIFPIIFCPIVWLRSRPSGTVGFSNLPEGEGIPIKTFLFNYLQYNSIRKQLKWIISSVATSCFIQISTGVRSTIVVQQVWWMATTISIFSNVMLILSNDSILAKVGDSLSAVMISRFLTNTVWCFEFSKPKSLRSSRGCVAYEAFLVHTIDQLYHEHKIANQKE